MTPIVIDVEGDGYVLTSGNEGVDFDILGDGNRVRVSWTAPGVDEAWLALDRNGNGLIDDARELFGNVTPQPDSEGDKHGFAALAAFDRIARGGNGDGWIDERDTIYRSLRLWQDQNHNGISERKELSTLVNQGITGISLDYKETKWTDLYGNQFRYRAVVRREGRGKGKTKWAYDVLLVRGE